MKNTELIICTEAGKLETYSKLLITSIRLIKDSFSEVPIYSYSPRENNELSDETLEFFEKNNVIHRNIKLNGDYQDYPLANKPIVCSYHERHSESENLIFCDSDTLFLKSPDLDFLKKYDLGVRPVDHKNIGVQSYNSGENGNYWKELHKITNVNDPKFIKTTLGKERIFTYFNSGLIFARKAKKIFSNWEKNFYQIYNSNTKPDNTFFIEQSCFAATVESLNVDYFMLPTTYNYPIRYYSKKWKGNYPFNINNVVHVHYHSIFQNKRGNRLISKIKNKELAQLVQESMNSLNF